ncbi:MAG: hypothetical protein ACREMK_15955 [Gemmatimonadota bacterium]
MPTMRSFDRYEIRLYGGNAGRVGLFMCYSGTSFAGRIDFHPDGVAMPQDYLWHPGTEEYVVLHMPMSRLESVLSTARIEKPLHLYIDVDRGIGAATSGHGYLTTTDKEPVGEEEGTP